MGIRANLRFHTQEPPYGALRTLVPEQVVITFEGRDFVWHPNLEPGPDGEEWWPGLTVTVEDMNDYEAEAESMHRLLSALSFEYRQPMEVAAFGASGEVDPFAPPIPRAARRGFGDLISEAPKGVEVVDDDRLKLVLALHREGLCSESPFYRFLSYWNALDAAFDNDESRMKSFVTSVAPTTGHRESYDPPPPDWWDYLRDSNRNAVAHAVRRPGKPVLNPDVPRDRERLYRDSWILDDLVRRAVEDRWGRWPVRILRR